MKALPQLLALLLLSLLTSCQGSAPTAPINGPSATKYAGDYVVLGRRYQILSSSAGYRKRGRASWYGKPFHGRQTANGEIFDMHQLTAAHRSLPLPTNARITNLENGRHVVVRINDRGPFHGDRLIDLSRAAAEAIGMREQGTAEVEVMALNPAPPAAAASTDRKQPIYLQVGSFSQQQNARRLQQELQKKGFQNIRLQQFKDQQNLWFRVYFGPLSASQAQQLEQRLQRAGYTQKRISRN